MRWGVPWVDTACLIDARISSIFKWRFGLKGAPELAHEQLAKLIAFLDVLSEVGLERPCFWLSKPLIKGYSVTPRHLYQSDSKNAATLIDYWAKDANLTEVADFLDKAIPGWKIQYATS
jgi:hypothetical protein